VTPLERLLAEELPTGRFGDGPAVPSSREAVMPRREAPRADPLAAAHRARLLAALAEKPTVDHRVQTRHLRAVPTPRSHAAA
jgi:hypothetical protein